MRQDRLHRAVTAGLLIALAPPAAAQPATTTLLPGAPPSQVAATIGRGTPKVTEKPDPATAAFRADPALAALGRRIFFDPRLSEPQGTSCAACHDPGRAFAPTLTAANPGTPPGSRPGHFSRRNAPSLLYVRYVPRRHFYQDDDAPFASPFGGLFADGRADSIAEQIRGPLFDADEMNNHSAPALLRKARDADWAPALAQRFGASVRSDADAMVRALGVALEAYLQSDEMAPFSSRYDAFIRRKGTLTARELRGLGLFRNPDKGNCASCHVLNETASRPERSLFTDFGFDAIGVPRNAALAANRNPGHFDKGLCDTAAKLRWPEPAQWCGYIRTPGLRNVALRQSFMHNGAIKSLRDAVEFYNTRGTDPAKWYAGGKAFDDQPAALQGNVNINSMPLNRRPGAKPALSEAEVDDIVAFLRTLTDAPFVSQMR